MQKKSFSAGLMFVVFLMVPGLALSQTAQHSGTFTVSGHSGEAPIIQVDGRSYVQIESLAHLTNGSLSYHGNQTTLTLHGPITGAPTTAPSESHTANSGFSKEFLKAGIEAMAEVREWRSALESAVQNGFPVGDNWIAGYRGPAATSIRLASVSASTDADRNAAQLLNNVFDNMQKLSDKMLSARKNMTYISPDALQNDPLDQKILACARSLASMAANGQFQDDGSCH
jgi:hypothetical protein